MPEKRAGPESPVRDKAAEANVQRMMMACERDPHLQEQLLQNPEEVAKRFDAQLAPEELRQIKHVAALRQVIDDFKVNRDVFRKPIFYPIDKWWKKVLSYHIIRYPIFYPVFYPVGYSWRGGIDEITTRSGRMAAGPIVQKWRWPVYPRDILINIDERINELTRTIQELKQMRGGG